MRTKLASVATLVAMFTMAGSAAALITANGMAEATELPTVVLGVEGADETPEEWTARTIRDGWKATNAADRSRVCSATADQIRAAAPRTTYDPTRYRVETAITVLSHLCQGR